MRLSLTAAALILSCISSNSLAEIFQCKQKDGRFSFSNSPCPSQVINGTSNTHALWRKMNQLIKEGSKISANMGPDYYSILSCNKKTEAFNLKVDAAYKELKSLSPKTHKRMYSAIESIRECGSCRASSSTYCTNATAKLLGETKVLAELAKTKRTTQYGKYALH